MSSQSTTPALDADAFIERLTNEQWTLGVIGQGYVGLPLVMTAAEAGLKAIGFDVNEGLVAQLNSGESHVEDVSSERLQHAIDEELVRFTADEQDLADADVLIVAVPSPLTRDRQPNLDYIVAAAQTVENVLRSGQLVSLESTTYPGTTEDYFLPIVERAGLKLDEDVYVCFSPERVDPGNVLQTADIPKVVGGVTEISGDVAAAAYARLVSSVHRVSTARAAELTKLLENTYRAVNIAMVNELAQFADAVDIDIWEVVDAAATKPFGFQPFYPGPGVGGHCIPLDPQFLAWRARSARVATRFIDLAEDLNLHMPNYTVSRVADALNNRGMAVSRARVVAIGVAYKPNIGDDRESPAWDVLSLLAGSGAEITVLDPHVDPARVAGKGYGMVDSIEAGAHDVAVVLTDHDVLDFAAIAAAVPLVFDTRGRYGRKGTPRPDNVLTL